MFICATTSREGTREGGVDCEKRGVRIEIFEIIDRGQGEKSQWYQHLCGMEDEVTCINGTLTQVGIGRLPGHTRQ